MTAPFRYRFDVTREHLDRAEPELADILWARNEARTQAFRARVSPRLLRWFGLALVAAGISLAWTEIVLAPDCPRSRGPGLSYAVLPVFVVLGTFFAFWPRVLPELRAWVRRRLAAQAALSLERARRRAPYAVEYGVLEGRLEIHLPRHRELQTVELAGVGAAVVGAGVACLFSRRTGWLRRVILVPGPAEGAALAAALRAAGVAVSPGPDAALAPPVRLA